jgi:chromate transporter
MIFLSNPAMTATATPPRLRTALGWWLKLGCISFGGPAGQIALMHDELVVRRRWISEARFLHALNYCMLLPGPEAQQLATYIGWLMHRTLGGVAAGLLFVLPSLLLMMLLSGLYLLWGDNSLLRGALYGIKPAVTAIVLAAAWRIGRRALRHPLAWLIALCAFLGIAVLQLPFPLIVFLAALAGWLLHRWQPGLMGSGAHAAPGSSRNDSKRNDNTANDDTQVTLHDELVQAAHTGYSSKRFALQCTVFAALWLGAMGLLWLAQHPLLLQLGEFFTKAALLTFGGAYAVLPYVQQAAVDEFGWLSAAQMMDGLALGETTPGPLIMIVAYIGFLGAWQQTLFGADTLALWLAGISGAAVATYFTFLPSFFFILAGGPLVESTRGDATLGAPLAGVTAAVVGVIASLALFFAQQVLWPSGALAQDGLRQPDWLAAAIGIAAAVALLRHQRGTVSVIVVCALVGMALRLI